MLRLFIITVGMALVLGVSHAEDKYDKRDHHKARAMVEAGEILPLEQLLVQVREKHPDWRLLELELEEKHHRPVYETEWLDEEGAVWELIFDARDGSLLKEER